MSPVGDLGLVDRELRVASRGQAGSVTDGTVDIGDDTARPAHEVVMVVPDPRLVAHHRACRLEATHQTRDREHPKYVVYRLVGHAREVTTDRPDQGDRVGVRISVHSTEHCQTRTGDPQGSTAQQQLELGLGDHTRSLTRYLEPVKKTVKSTVTEEELPSSWDCSRSAAARRTAAAGVAR